MNNRFIMHRESIFTLQDSVVMRFESTGRSIVSCFGEQQVENGLRICRDGSGIMGGAASK